GGAVKAIAQRACRVPRRAGDVASGAGEKGGIGRYQQHRDAAVDQASLGELTRGGASDELGSGRHLRRCAQAFAERKRRRSEDEPERRRGAAKTLERRPRRFTRRTPRIRTAGAARTHLVCHWDSPLSAKKHGVRGRVEAPLVGTGGPFSGRWSRGMPGRARAAPRWRASL